MGDNNGDERCGDGAPRDAITELRRLEELARRHLASDGTDGVAVAVRGRFVHRRKLSYVSLVWRLLRRTCCRAIPTHANTWAIGAAVYFKQSARLRRHSARRWRYVANSAMDRG